jgi:hypothetical protein
MRIVSQCPSMTGPDRLPPPDTMAFPARPSATLALSLSAALFTAVPLAAQSASGAAPVLTLAEVRALVEAHLVVSAIHDSSDNRAAQQKNKTNQAQQELQLQKRELISAALAKKGLADSVFSRRRFLVSSDATLRAQFDSILAAMTGAPLPGVVAAAPLAPGAVAASSLPAGLVGTHIGHVVSSFMDTPDKSGFLPMALAEAKIAAQHAGFAARTPDNLQAMQTHAGHIIHAIDPTQATGGPGKGFGMKRAAGGIAQHIELAAKEPTASPNVKTHATHIATAARATMSRGDQAIALAKQIQAATTAAAAASLMSQLVSLCDQFIAGTDINADGRIGWAGGEGALQQAQEHVTLMLAGEKKP